MTENTLINKSLVNGNTLCSLCSLLRSWQQINMQYHLKSINSILGSSLSTLLVGLMESNLINFSFFFFRYSPLGWSIFRYCWHEKALQSCDYILSEVILDICVHLCGGKEQTADCLLVSCSPHITGLWHLETPQTSLTRWCHLHRKLTVHSYTPLKKWGGLPYSTPWCWVQ